MDHQKRTKRLTIALIFGGTSGEHEVSIVSASSVLRALDPAKYDVIAIGVDRNGRWLSTPDAPKLLSEMRLPKRGQRAIQPGEGKKGLISVKSALRSQNLAPQGIDVAFPLIHGPLGEDGTIQGLLELAGIPYIGSGVLGSAVGMDKITMKDVFRSNGIPTPASIGVRVREWEQHPTAVIKRIQQAFGYPCFVKPANLGSSVGISKVVGRGLLGRAIRLAFRYDRRIIVEEGIVGRELECAVLGNDVPEASVPGEVVPKGAFYTYAAKYESGTTDLIIPAKLATRQRDRIQDLACSAFIALDRAGMARVDFFLERSGKILVNEINTIPGLTNISMYPKLWEASGVPYADLIDRLIALALERHQQKLRYRKPSRKSVTWHRRVSA